MKCNSLILICLLTLPIMARAEYICQPVTDQNPNPYKLMNQEMRPPSTNRSCAEWEVYANRDGVPIVDIEKNIYAGLSAKFLDPFVVVRKYEDLLQVCPQHEFDYQRKECRINNPGFIYMKDLILYREAIRNEYSIYQKAFIKVKIDEMIDQNLIGDEAEILCFRAGPGPIGARPGSFRALSGKNDIPKLSNLFYYIYGVAYKKGHKELFTDQKFISQADYFLLGNGITTKEQDLKKNILGWLPKEAVVPWETRQALELIKNRPMEVHKFEAEGDLTKYFRTPSSQRPSFLDELVKEKKAEKDTGKTPVFSGQMLRPLILKLSKPHPGEMSLERALIGFTGDLIVRSGNDGGKKENIDKKVLSDLALIGEGTKYVDVFFLIDATTSMEPVIPLAARTVNKIKKELSHYKDLNVFIRAAIYRDDNDGIREYQVWPGQGDLADWLNKIDISKNPSDDYRESLFEGIYRSVKDWRFSHPRSVRLLVLLGDAGDNHRSRNLTSANEVARLLMDRQILPLPIHFNHPFTKENLDPGGWGAICDDSRIKHLPATYINAWERSAMCDFVNNMDEVIDIMNRGVINPNARIRKTNSMRVNDLAKFLDKSVGHLMDCLSTSITKIFDARSGTASISKIPVKPDSDPSDAITPMFEYRMEKLKSKYPGLGALLENRAEMAFLKAYVPIRYEDKPLMRPVWLLSSLELTSIDNSIDILRIKGAAGCELKMMNEQVRSAVLSALGDMLYMSPMAVTDENLENWVQAGIVSDSNSYVDLAQERLEDICYDKVKWNNFINHLEKVDEHINEIRRDPNQERAYFDKLGTRFYWVYPNELYPFAE